MIYGTSKGYGTRVLSLNEPNCKNCEVKGSLEITSFTTYAHVMFIPTITAGKHSIIKCYNCGKEYPAEKQSKAIKALISSEQSEIRMPLWHFVGIPIFVGIIIWVNFLAS